MTNETATQTQEDIETVVDGYRDLIQVLAGARTPELPDSSVTMAQMRVLMLLSAVDQMRMSELASSLGISQSTASGLVDRLVEHHLVARHTDDVDRRQVLVALTAEGTAFLDHFQELGITHLRDLLALLSPADVATVRRAIELLIKAAHELPMEDPT